MKIIALILAVFVAFPNLGYSLTSNCCSHESEISLECSDDLADNTEKTQKDHEPCSGQCDCSCCHTTFLIKVDLQAVRTSNPDFLKTSPLDQGTSFTSGYTGHIWQPPKIG